MVNCILSPRTSQPKPQAKNAARWRFSVRTVSTQATCKSCGKMNHFLFALSQPSQATSKSCSRMKDFLFALSQPKPQVRPTAKWRIFCSHCPNPSHNYAGNGHIFSSVGEARGDSVVGRLQKRCVYHPPRTRTRKVFPSCIYTFRCWLTGWHRCV